jgi:hypothetical protein
VVPQPRSNVTLLGSSAITTLSRASTNAESARGPGLAGAGDAFERPDVADPSDPAAVRDDERSVADPMIRPAT